MGRLKNERMDEIEQRANYADCQNDDEFFESLESNGIYAINWSDSLDRAFSRWMYLNNK